MRFGYWLPVFGGWLRNVDDERMAATWSYVRTLAQQSERWGFDLTLIAELNLNDIKGTRAPSLDAWSTAASLAAVTSTLELMVAVRPTFHEPALLAKQAANIDHISDGRLHAERRVVVVGRRGEAVRRALRSARRALRAHARMADRRRRPVARAGVLVQGPVLRRAEHHPRAEAVAAAAADDLHGRRVAGGEGSDRGDERRLRDARRRARSHRRAHPRSVGAARAPAHCSASAKVGTTRGRCSSASPATPSCAIRTTTAMREVSRITDVKQSSAGYGNYQQWISNTQLEQRVSLEDYSVSNRGLRSGLIGTPEAVLDRVREFEAAGVDLLLLQCSPQLEEMERFGAAGVSRRTGDLSPHGLHMEIFRSERDARLERRRARRRRSASAARSSRAAGSPRSTRTIRRCRCASRRRTGSRSISGARRAAGNGRRRCRAIDRDGTHRPRTTSAGRGARSTG